MSALFKYPGDELVLFQHAKHWKKYFTKQISRYIKGDVLEVGAGIGSTTNIVNAVSLNSFNAIVSSVSKRFNDSSSFKKGVNITTFSGITARLKDTIKKMIKKSVCLYANRSFRWRKYFSKKLKLSQLIAIAMSVASTETEKCVNHPLL